MSAWHSFVLTLDYFLAISCGMIVGLLLVQVVRCGMKRLYRSALWHLVRNLNPLDKALIFAGGAIGAFGMWLVALLWLSLFCK